MGDFGSATEAMRIIDLFALQVFAKNLDRCNFRLLQHYRSLADLCQRNRYVRFSLNSRHSDDRLRCPLCAKSRPMQRSKRDRYSITSSARPSSVAGTSMPSALAVDRLMTSSNLVGCWTGKSAGLVPLRILCTYVAVCRDKSGRFAP